MITEYKDYIEKMKKYKMEWDRSVAEYKNKLLNDFEDEFSKYLKVKIVNNPDIKFYTNDAKIKLFLLDDDFGIRIEVNEYENINKVKASIETVYSIKDKFYLSTGIYHYDPEKGAPVEEFVKKYVDALKKKNIKRKDDKYKRELKKVVNKYNL